MSKEVVYKSGFDEVWINYDEKRIGMTHFVDSVESPGITIWRTGAKRPFYEMDAFGKKTIYGYEKLLEMIKNISKSAKNASIFTGHDLPNMREAEKLIRNREESYENLGKCLQKLYEKFG